MHSHRVLSSLASALLKMTASRTTASTALGGFDTKEANVEESATGDSGSSLGVDDLEGERTQARLLLTPDEEKKLLRRIDWHLMPLCSLIFMFKNLDSNNVSTHKQNIDEFRLWSTHLG